MSTLVERLRARGSLSGHEPTDLELDAADEIERLHGLIQEALDVPNGQNYIEETYRNSRVQGILRKVGPIRGSSRSDG